MDKKQQEIQIPKVHYEGQDKKLLGRVRKFKAGSQRIIVFTIVGLVMGWFSINYYTDTFIVTKILLAIPYKISEAIYTSILGTGARPIYGSMLADINVYFSQSMLATFLAERVTPVLIGGAFYGTIGYFTGAREVFTLGRFVKFTAVWSAIIVLFVGSVYGVNAKAVSDNDKMKNIAWFYLVTPSQGEAIMDPERRDIMVTALMDELYPDYNISRDFDNEHEFQILFDDGLRNVIAYINWDRNYMVTENGSYYHVSEEFGSYIKEYYETGKLLGVQNIFPIERSEDE